MSIASGNTITWTEFTSAVLSAIQNNCSNRNNLDNITARLRNGYAAQQVKSLSSTIPSGHSGASAHTNYWYAAAPTRPVVAVSDSTIETEWTTFVSAAGAAARSTKIMSAYEITRALGLFQQFMAYHLKQIHSRGQIYGGSTVQYTRYLDNATLGGACTPKYTITAVEQGNIPVISNTDINGSGGVVRQSIFHDGVNYGLIDKENNPYICRTYLY